MEDIARINEILGPSPFHPGEQAAQERVGIRDQIEVFGRRVIRDHMPDEHRAFYNRLPFVLIGSVDELGRPWASMVAGAPGFVTSPDMRTLNIGAPFLPGDPLSVGLKTGSEVGILGLEPETRRRNRLTGRVAEIGSDGFAIAIDQAFGNCPQYIRARSVEFSGDEQVKAGKPEIIRSDIFDDVTRGIIESADTFFIATAYSAGRGLASDGADVSHRGGKPGFVRIEGDNSFVFPDFSGNNHFNTVGNISLNPRAGFLFPDFDTGALVYMSGRAEIIWDGPLVEAFTGAERLIRFTGETVVRVEHCLALKFSFGDASPALERTGSWAGTDNVYHPYEVFDVRAESEAITSFYLRRADGKTLAAYEPGQFLPIKLTLPGLDAPVLRTYTLSDSADHDYYRLSIKRQDGDALVSSYLHDQAKPGFRLEAMAPRGGFHLDRSNNRPVVLLSAGVGVTPMIAMANDIIAEGQKTGNMRHLYFIHGTQNGRSHAFAGHIANLSGEHAAVTTHIAYSRAQGSDQCFDSQGHVDVALLKSVLPFDDYDFYLCGPAPFMQSLYDGLLELGVRDERVHFESFGPATVRKQTRRSDKPAAVGKIATDPVTVKFSKSNIEAVWSPEKGTLLELAEQAGLSPAFSCRSGNCGTCATRLTGGAVDYATEPSAAYNDGEVLLCCTTPRSTSGEDGGIVLSL